MTSLSLTTTVASSVRFDVCPTCDVESPSEGAQTSPLSFMVSCVANTAMQALSASVLATVSCPPTLIAEGSRQSSQDLFSGLSPSSKKEAPPIIAQGVLSSTLFPGFPCQKSPESSPGSSHPNSPVTDTPSRLFFCALKGRTPKASLSCPPSSSSRSGTYSDVLSTTGASSANLSPFSCFPSGQMITVSHKDVLACSSSSSSSTSPPTADASIVPQGAFVVEPEASDDELPPWVGCGLLPLIEESDDEQPFMPHDTPFPPPLDLSCYPLPFYPPRVGADTPGHSSLTLAALMEPVATAWRAVAPGARVELPDELLRSVFPFVFDSFIALLASATATRRLDEVQGDRHTGFIMKETLHPQARLIFVGDIHGNFSGLIDTLMSLQRDGILDAQFHVVNEADRVLFVGDYCDRSPYGTECLTLLIHFQNENPNQVYLIRGNHEHPDMHRYHQGLYPPQQRDGHLCEVVTRSGRHLLDFYNTLPDSMLFVEASSMLVATHAGIAPALDLDPLIQAPGARVYLPLPVGIAVCPSVRVREIGKGDPLYLPTQAVNWTVRAYIQEGLRKDSGVAATYGFSSDYLARLSPIHWMDLSLAQASECRSLMQRAYRLPVKLVANYFHVMCPGKRVLMVRGHEHKTRYRTHDNVEIVTLPRIHPPTDEDQMPERAVPPQEPYISYALLFRGPSGSWVQQSAYAQPGCQSERLTEPCALSALGTDSAAEEWLASDEL